jgi:hypothetical protein
VQGWSARTVRPVSAAHTGDADVPPLDDSVAPEPLPPAEEAQVFETAFSGVAATVVRGSGPRGTVMLNAAAGG